jgi:hypothetical protein
MKHGNQVFMGILVIVALQASVVGASASGLKSRTEIIEHLICKVPDNAFRGIYKAFDVPDWMLCVRSNEAPLGPPDWVSIGKPNETPAGPPDWVPVGKPNLTPPGPPDWVSVGRPDDVQTGPPSWAPRGVPEAVPVGPPG